MRIEFAGGSSKEIYKVMYSNPEFECSDTHREALFRLLHYPRGIS